MRSHLAALIIDEMDQVAGWASMRIKPCGSSPVAPSACVESDNSPWNKPPRRIGYWRTVLPTKSSFSTPLNRRRRPGASAYVPYGASRVCPGQNERRSTGQIDGSSLLRDVAQVDAGPLERARTWLEKDGPSAGVTMVTALASRNEPDLDDVPESVRAEIHIHPVSTVAEVLSLALSLDVASGERLLQAD